MVIIFSRYLGRKPDYLVVIFVQSLSMDLATEHLFDFLLPLATVVASSITNQVEKKKQKIVRYFSWLLGKNFGAADGTQQRDEDTYLHKERGVRRFFFFLPSATIFPALLSRQLMTDSIDTGAQQHAMQ